MNNLPIPQSRSEELMNAFIQRDSSQISTPQSRIEEFWYHLIEGTNSLPIPQSRNELLLKKIIENDTHQIPLAQSRTEEFLVSILTGDINKLPIPQSRSEYYLDYIARNNLLLNDIDYVRYSGTNITATNTVQKPFRSAILKGQTLVNFLNIKQYSSESGSKVNVLSVGLKSNTKYIIIADVKNDNANQLNGKYVYNDGTNGNDFALIPRGKNGKIKNIFTTPDNQKQIKNMNVYNVGGHNTKPLSVDNMILCEYQEGMENWDIPYFEGMQSVKKPVLTTSNEDGTKTNILTTPEDLELRGIGNVKDTLDISTGEVVERIGEIVLDGNIGWSTNTNWSKGNYYTCYTRYVVNKAPGLLNIISPSYKTGRILTNSVASDEFIAGESGNNVIYLTLSKSKLTADENGGYKSSFINYLNNNPITVQYQLATPVIKTVDLKVVNQDGNQVKELSAFDGTTYIVSGSASDNSLIAITEVEVPTKLIEVLDGVKSLSSDVEILINEVDNTQKLQDENSTMAMSAMTELYEMILMMGGND